MRGDEGGICHQILPENGYMLPGHVVVGTDSHTTSHGALGAFSFGIGATEMAAVWTLGSVFNVEVPATIKVVVNGALPPRVLPEGPDPAPHRHAHPPRAPTSRSSSSTGETIEAMSTSGRLTICNMSVEAGATSGIVPADRRPSATCARRRA